MDNPFFLARGPCAGCGRTVAKRAQAAGEVAVTCNVCRAESRLHAVEVRMTPEGPRPVSPPTAATAAAAPPRRSRGVLAAALVGALVVIAGAGAAAWLLLKDEGGVAALVGGAAEDAGGTPWAVADQKVLVEFGEDTVRFRVETKAYDADGNPIEGPLADPPLFHFGTTDGLVEPGDVTFAACDPAACAYEAPLGAFVSIANGRPARNLGWAFDTANRTLHLYTSVGGWRVIDDWESHFASFRSAKAVAVPAAESGVRVTVFVHEPGTVDRPLQLRAVQAGRTLVDDELRLWGMEMRSLGPSFDADRAPFEVQLLDPDGAVLASGTFDPSACEGYGYTLNVVVQEDGAAGFGEAGCE